MRRANIYILYVSMFNELKAGSADNVTIVAPANEAIEFYDTDFENTFAHQTIYRGVPSIALEKAWEDLWYRKSTVSIVNEVKSLTNDYDRWATKNPRRQTSIDQSNV